MKYLAGICLLLLLQSSFGQACGVYRIRYTGTLTGDPSHQIITILLPAPRFLHGLEKEDNNLSFIEVKPMDGKFNLTVRSPLTTAYQDPELLLKDYKNVSEKFRMKFVTRDLKETMVEFGWDSIQVSKTNDEGPGSLFEFNLKNIPIPY